MDATEFHLLDATLEQLQTALQAQIISSKNLVEMYLERISAYDRQGPEIRALLSIHPKAVELAIELDMERKIKGSRGMLHGIPILIKDNYNTKDMPTTCGTKVLETFLPQNDATVVNTLREAGAIVLGKTNLHELALFGTTRSTLGGQTRNPYDLTRTPGGSSGGTGAGISANFAAVGIGTDAVNSVRSPASANNLVGIRPTKGLVSLEGIIPVSFTQDNAGPLARTVGDAAALLEVMVGAKGKYTGSLTHDLMGRRIGVLRNFFGGQPIHAEVNEISELALQVMRDLGADMIDIEVPGLDADNLLLGLDVQRYEIKHELEKYFNVHGAPIKTFSELLDAGHYDIATLSFLESVQAIADPLNQADYRLRLAKIKELKLAILNVMDRWKVDALFYPHQKRLVVGIGQESQADRNGILSALTGFPSITFQGGFSKPTEFAPIGVPVGIELLGRPYHEARLIEVVNAFEHATHHRRLPPFTPAL